MATDVERLVVQMSADFKAYERELAKAQKTTVTALKKIERDAQKSAASIEKAYGGIGGKFSNLGAILQGAFQALSVERVVTGMRDVVKSVADIGDAADKLGLSTDEFQRLQFVAKLAGVETETFANGMKKLELNSSAASRGQGDLGKIIAANGVSIRDQNGDLLSQSEILLKVADLVRNAANEQDQAAIAAAAFGKSGVDLLNLLREGSAGVAMALKDASSSTDFFTEKQVRDGQKIDDRFDALIDKIGKEFKSAVLQTALTTVREWDAITNAIDVSKSYLDAWLGSLGSAVTLSNELAQTVAGGKVDREIGMTPANPDGKGALPSNIDGRTFSVVRPTVIPVTPSSSSAAASKAISDAERQRQAIEKVIESLKFEGQQLKVNDLQQKINSELRSAGVSATSAQGQEIARLVTANYNLEASQRLVNLATENYATQLSEIRDGQMELARMGVDAFNRMAISGENVTDVLVSLADQLAEAAVNAALLGSGPMAALFGTSSSGGLIGSLLGGGASSFAGLYANGGQIPSGKIGIAGEAGPEIIRGPANVIPMNRMTGGGGTHVTIVQNIAANGDKAVADIAYAQTQRALRDVEMRRPQADVERRLRTQ